MMTFWLSFELALNVDCFDFSNVVDERDLQKSKMKGIAMCKRRKILLINSKSKN